MSPELVASRSADLDARIVADSRDRVSWIRARSRGITATDVAALTSANAISRAADAKLMGSSFSGNAFTAHGRRREPEIAAWVAATHGIRPSSALYHAVVEKRHLATPDGVVVDGEGRVILAEIKTTNKAWRSIPKTYMRQIWWQQHVLGAERTLVAWEQHDGFVPCTMSRAASGSSATSARSPSSWAWPPRSSTSCTAAPCRRANRAPSPCDRNPRTGTAPSRSSINS